MPEKKRRNRLLGGLTLAVGVASCGGAGVDAVECAPEGVVLEGGVEVRDVVCGAGAVAASGASVTVRYETRLEDGDLVKQPRGRGSYTFRLGAGQVVPAWDQGLAGMAVGGTRELVVPPDLAYGEAGLYPEVPPGGSVMFEVELLDVDEPDSESS